MLKTFSSSIIVLCLFTLIPSSQVYAASGVGRIVHTYGPAWIERGETREKIRKGRVVLRNDSIITGARGRVKLIMGDGSKVYVGAKSRISLRKYSLRGKKLLNASINMLWGKARFFVNKLASRNASFRVQTSTAVLGVRGTEFSVWVPPTPELLSRAFDHITLADIPPLPTRTVLMEGAVDIENGLGIQYRLTPGNTADVDINRKIQVRQTNSKDLEEHSQPLVIIPVDINSNATDSPKQHKRPQSAHQTGGADENDIDTDHTPSNQTGGADENDIDTDHTPSKNQRDSKTQGQADQVKPTANGQQPNAQNKPNKPTQANHSTNPVANTLPDNPQFSDAASIMFDDAAAGLADQPSMPAPPAVAAPLLIPNTANLPGNGNGQGSNNPEGNGQTNNGSNSNAPAANTPPPPAMNPLLGGLPGGGNIPIDPQAISNAIQNLGTATDIEIRPNFVKP
ncbi:MAG: FecR domain-containing protein [Mariprofundaceae bacterium]|nr:FecR domain-containing protein [Mariprofundaceae bacterium]